MAHWEARGAFDLSIEGMNVKKQFPVVLAAIAAAAAIPTIASAQTAAPTFSGPHIGVSAGWNQGRVDEGTGSARLRDNQSGVAVRGAAGYDVAIGNSAIIGAEIGIASGGRDIIATRGANRYRVDPGVALDASARIGVKPTSALLVYGKAGWAAERVKTSLTNGTRTIAGKSTEHGFLWGGGLEVAMSKNVSLKAEYDRVSFNDQYKRNRLLGGVNFRF